MTTTHTIQPINYDALPPLPEDAQMITADIEDNEIHYLRDRRRTVRYYNRASSIAAYRAEGWNIYLLTAEQAADFAHSTPSIDAETGNLILTPRNNKHDRFRKVRHAHQAEDGLAHMAESSVAKQHGDMHSLLDIVHYVVAEMKESARGTDRESDVATMEANITTQTDAIRARVIDVPYFQCVFQGGKVRGIAATGPDGVHDNPALYAKAEAVESITLERYFVREMTVDEYTGEIVESVAFSEIMNGLFDGELSLTTARNIAPELRKILYREVRKAIADNPMQDEHFDADGALNDAGIAHYTALFVAAEGVARPLMIAHWRATLS